MIDLYSQQYLLDPFPFYRKLRTEAPIAPALIPQTFLVSRYDDVVTVLKQPAVFSSTSGANRRASLIGSSFVTKDAPEHTRLRGMVSRNFAPRVIELLAPRVRAVSNQLIDAIVAGGRRDMDLIADFALPLPLTIIADLLGVDPDHNQDFHRWSDILLASTDTPPTVADDEVQKAVAEFSEYFRRHYRERIASPGNDLISQLTRAGADEQPMATEDMLAYVALLLIAGNETTANLLGNTFAALTDCPDQLAKVQAQPELAPRLVEESLRFNGPAPVVFRRTLAATQLAGMTIPENHRLILLLASANRDDAQFPDPDRFDVERDASRHVAFAQGPHFCLGAPLARLEGSIALDVLLSRLTDFRRLNEAVKWRQTPLVRGPATLPLAFQVRN
jgi:cytochrome P450